MPECTIQQPSHEGRAHAPRLLIVESFSKHELIDAQLESIQKHFGVQVVVDTYNQPSDIPAIVHDAKTRNYDMVLVGDSYNKYFGDALLTALKAGSSPFAGPVAIQASDPTPLDIASAKKIGGLGVYSNDVNVTLHKDGPIAALVAEYEKGRSK